MARIKSKLVPVLVSSVITFCACGSIENTVPDGNTGDETEKNRVNPPYTAENSISFGRSIEISGLGIYICEDSVNIVKGGSYSVTGQTGGLSFIINVSVDETVTLNLDNVTLTTAEKPIINCENAGELNIVLARGSDNRFFETEKENNINNINISENETGDLKSAFIYANCPVTISGEGNLLIKTAEESSFNKAFECGFGLQIKEAVLNIDTPHIDSITLGGDLICESGSINIEAGKNGIICRQYTAENANVNIDVDGEKIIRHKDDFNKNIAS